RVGGGEQLRAARADRAQRLGEPRPRPRLDLAVARLRLAARRVEVLEPGIGLLHEQELVRLPLGGWHRDTSPVGDAGEYRTAAGRCRLVARAVEAHCGLADRLRPGVADPRADRETRDRDE